MTMKISHRRFRSTRWLLILAMLTLSGACHAAAADDAGGATVRMYKGKPTIFVDGEPIPFAAYSPPGRMPVALENTRRFFQHDMAVYFINVPRGKPPEGSKEWNPSPFWDGNRIETRYIRELTTPSMDEQAKFILDNAPNAKFIIRFGPGEPWSWHELHPDEMFRTETGKIIKTPSLASEQYRKDSARLIEAVIRLTEQHEWSDHVIGYWTGHRVEGSHEPVIHGWMFDHSPVMLERWRQFLREKYEIDAALRQAWNDPDVTLKTVTVPTDPLRKSTPEVSASLYWQPASKNQPLRDYYQLTTQLYHELFIAQAAAHHRATDRNRIFLIDALKQPMLGWENVSFFDPNTSRPLAYHGMQSGSGNLHAAELLELDSFDGLITPHDYQARHIGGVYQPEGIVQSVLLRGKVFVSEMDTRSYTARWDRIANARNDKEFAAITWRNYAATWAGGYYSYWMDVFEDWFASEGIHEIIGRQVEVLRDAADWPHETMPGIAVIIDDASVYETNGDATFLNEAIMWELKMGLARCGVPFRIYLLEDLAIDNFPEHRVFYFPNLFKVTDQRLALLREKVFRNGHVVLWGPGSGISNGKTIDKAHATRLTGFEFEQINSNAMRRVLIAGDHPIIEDVPEGTFIGGRLAYGPVLMPRSGQELGRLWSKRGINAPGIVAARRGEGDEQWTSVFTTAVGLPASFWRGLAAHAGAHVYTQNNDVIMASRHVVALHTVHSGDKVIDLPEPARVVDVITGEQVAERTERIEVNLEAPATVVYRIDPLE